MADNYLERKMEEHRNGRDLMRRSDSARSGVLQPGLHLSYPKMWVLVTADRAAEAAPFVAALRSAGINVALCFGIGGKEARELSQKYGARLYPDRCPAERILDDLGHCGNKPDYILDIRSNPSDMPGTTILSRQTQQPDPTILARAFLFLIHPDNKALSSFQSLFTFL